MGLFDSLKNMGDMMSRGMGGMMGGAAGGVDPTAIQNEWDEALKEVGLSGTHSEPVHPEGKHILQGGDEARYTGTVNGVETEWHFLSYSFMERSTANQYTFVNERNLHFFSEAIGGWELTLAPRGSGMEGGVKTGVEAFDEAFHVTTNDEARFKEVFSDDILQDFVDRGWMHLRIGGNAVTVIDDYMDQFAASDKKAAGMQMLSATHPLFGTSASQMTPNRDILARFLDVITTLVKKIG